MTPREAETKGLCDLYWLLPVLSGLELWIGYTKSEDSNFHYAKFDGIHQDGSAIWVYGKSELPENAVWITDTLATKIIYNVRV
jgi:hypothetical protein